MLWHQDPGHPFAGISEKLKRADQNIVNLNNEILQFFTESKYPAIPDVKDQSWQDAVNYHRGLQVPKRFSVLAGEIIHHLRSCLDHIVWHFSSDTAKLLHENALEFPIFSKPLTKDDLPRYNRKIQGITKPGVLAIIEQLQPYQRGADAGNDPLGIVHDMDRFDKHRELVIVTASCQVEFPAGTSIDIVQKAMAYTQGEALPKDVIAAIGTQIKKHHHVTPDVAFAQVGEWTTQPVVPSLMKLMNAVDDVAELFAAEV